MATRNRGRLVSRTIKIATTKALTARNPQYNLGHIDLDSCALAKSLFKRMGLTKRMSTTGKIEITARAKEDDELLFMYEIVALVEENNIYPNLIMNLDQTPSKYVPSGRHILTEKGCKSMHIADSANKGSITVTFIITFNGDFLPMQLKYGGKTIQSFPWFKFSDSFWLSVNPSHFSNTIASIKVTEEIVVPFVKEQRRSLQLPNKATFIVMDLFQSKMAVEVLDILRAYTIYLYKVPANMTHLFQPFDLAVNNHCKVFMKNKFGEWFTKQVENWLKHGLRVEEINILFRLTTMNPHAHCRIRQSHHIWVRIIYYNQWLENYSYIRSDYFNSTELPFFDPFQDTFPLPVPSIDLSTPSPQVLPNDLCVNFINDHEDDSEYGSEYGKSDDPVDFTRNAFDILIVDENGDI